MHKLNEKPKTIYRTLRCGGESHDTIMKIIDYFAKNEITLDYEWDKEEEDFVSTNFVGLLEEDEDLLMDIEEGAEDRIYDYVFDLLRESEDEKNGSVGQLLNLLFETKEISEEEGLEAFKKYKAINDDDDFDFLEFIHENVIEKGFEEANLESAIRQYFSEKGKEGDLNKAVNGVPLFVIDSFINSIIENTLGEYEGDLHFDIGGGWLDGVIPVSI